MQVRRAVFADIDRIIGMAVQLVQEAGLPQQVDPVHTRAVLRALMLRDDAAVWVSVGGFLAASIERTVISPEPVAVEHGWFATDRSGLRLLRLFEGWAAARGAIVRLSTGQGGPDLRRLGYRAVETAWVK